MTSSGCFQSTPVCEWTWNRPYSLPGVGSTETVGSLNEGAMLKAKQGGVFRSKQWVSQRDGRVRDTHRAAEAAGWIPIDQPYSNGLDYPHAPGSPAAEVVNCRCSQMFSDLPPNEANAEGGT